MNGHSASQSIDRCDRISLSSYGSLYAGDGDNDLQIMTAELYHKLHVPHRTPNWIFLASIYRGVICPDGKDWRTEMKDDERSNVKQTDRRTDRQMQCVVLTARGKME